RGFDVDLADLFRQFRDVLLRLFPHRVGDARVVDARTQEEAEMIERVDVMAGDLLGACEVEEERRSFDHGDALPELEPRLFEAILIDELETFFEARLCLGDGEIVRSSDGGQRKSGEKTGEEEVLFHRGTYRGMVVPKSELANEVIAGRGLVRTAFW